MKMSLRAHPLMILGFIKPLLFIAVLPLVRAVVYYLITGNKSGVIVPTLTLLASIIFIAVMRWRSVFLTVTDDKLTVSRGFFIRAKAQIDFSKLSSITLKENPIDKISGAVTLCINTEAGSTRKDDFNIKIYIDDGVKLSHYIYGERGQTAFCVSPVKIAAMAATTSSAVSGLLIGVPILNRTAALFGFVLSDYLPDKIGAFGQGLRIITVFMLLGYFFSAVLLFFKHLFLRVCTDRKKIEIRSGLLVRRRTLFYKSSINSINVEQTTLMRLFGRFMLRVSVGGYGDERGGRAIIVPCGTKDDIKKHFLQFFPFFGDNGTPIKPPHGKKALSRFFFVPACFSAAVMTVGSVAVLLFPAFFKVIIFLSFISAAVICYYCSLCLYNYRFGQITFGKSISARTTSGFLIREFYCPNKKVGEIKLIQYPADRRYGTCKVKITVRSRSADRIKVRNIGFDGVKDAISRCFGE